MPASVIVDALSKIKAGKQLLVFETCESGCVCYEIDTKHPPAVLFTSSGCDNAPSDGVFTTVSGVPHGLWTYWIDGALMGSLPPHKAVECDTPSPELKFKIGNTLSTSFEQAYEATLDFQEDPQQPSRTDDADLSTSTRIDVDDPVGNTGASASSNVP